MAKSNKRHRTQKRWLAYRDEVQGNACIEFRFTARPADDGDYQMPPKTSFKMAQILDAEDGPYRLPPLFPGDRGYEEADKLMSLIRSLRDRMFNEFLALSPDVGRTTEQLAEVIKWKGYDMTKRAAVETQVAAYKKLPGSIALPDDEFGDVAAYARFLCLKFFGENNAPPTHI